MVKNLPDNAGAKEGTGLIPGSARSHGGGDGNPLSNLAWKILWREKPGRLQSTGSQRVGYNLVTEHTAQM